MSNDKHSRAITKLSDLMEDHFKDDENSFARIDHAFVDINSSLVEIKNMVSDLKTESTPVNEWFKNINFSKRALMWLLGLFSALVGLALAIKSLIR